MNGLMDFGFGFGSLLEDSGSLLHLSGRSAERPYTRPLAMNQKRLKDSIILSWPW